MLFVYHRWTRPTILFALTTICLIICINLTSVTARLITLAVILILLYNLVIESWVAFAFIAPGKRKKELIAPGWSSQFHNCETIVHTMSYFDDEIRPLVIIIHGWRSGASSMQGRAEHYIRLGFHVIIFELPGHGKSESVSKWTAGHASTTFNDFFDRLDDWFDLRLVNNVYLHGHSMGGFVLLRFDRLKSKGENRIKGYILESPMTCYSMIFEESLQTLKIPNFAVSAFWSRLSRHFNQINPRIADVTDLSEVDTPKWGLIRNNCIVVQAEQDDRLGLEHYYRLIEHQQNVTNYIFEHHLVTSLSHAGARQNTIRDALIESWLDSVKDHSDSA